MKSLFSEGLKKVKKLKKEQWFVMFLAGVLILVIFMQVENKQTEEKKAEAEASSEGKEDGDYIQQLEQRTADILRQMNQVGKVKVMITVKNDGNAVVEKDVAKTESENENSYSEETVYTGEEQERPMVVSNRAPEVEGVVVVCDGGNIAGVQQNIIDAIEALFSIESHKIKVVKRAGGQ